MCRFFIMQNSCIQTFASNINHTCGISGQIQHVAGMQDSSIIISINNDENAPINAISDYVITGNMEDIVPKLIKYYKKNSK